MDPFNKDQLRKRLGDGADAAIRGAERDLRRDPELTAQLKEWRQLISEAEAADDILKSSELTIRAAQIARKLQNAFRGFVNARKKR